MHCFILIKGNNSILWSKAKTNVYQNVILYKNLILRFWEKNKK